ncbi:MAG: hypothetical protein MI717_05140, partial [Spirochaetales bacterium]|nr:hypothetical protein [Spirochaetales bacterium]
VWDGYGENTMQGSSLRIVCILDSLKTKKIILLLSIVFCSGCSLFGEEFKPEIIDLIGVWDSFEVTSSGHKSQLAERNFSWGKDLYMPNFHRVIDWDEDHNRIILELPGIGILYISESMKSEVPEQIKVTFKMIEVITGFPECLISTIRFLDKNTIEIDFKEGNVLGLVRGNKLYRFAGPDFLRSDVIQ